MKVSRNTIEVDLYDGSQYRRVIQAYNSAERQSKEKRKDQNTIKKIQVIRDTIQDSVLYAKLKKSIERGDLIIYCLTMA
jgi:hypothetical protein